MGAMNLSKRAYQSIEWQDLQSTYQAQRNWSYLIALIALKIRQSLELGEILQTTASEVQNLLDCDRVLLYRFEPDWSGRVVVESVSDPQWSLLDRVIYDSCSESCWSQPYQEGKFTTIEDLATANLTSCHAEFLAGFQVKANLVIPVLQKANLWGLLTAHNCTAPRPWQPEEIEGLQRIAVEVGIAIYQASLVEQLQAAKTDLEAQIVDQTQEIERANQQCFQLAAIIESSQDAIVSETPEGIITSWNRAAEQLFGYAAEEMIGSSVKQLIPIALQEEAVKILQSACQGKIVDTYETQRLHKDGRLLDVALTISPIYDETGRVVGASKIARDIREQQAARRERKQAELALQQSERTTRALIQSIPDLMFRVNRQGIYLSSPETLGLIALQGEEKSLGNNMAEYLPTEVFQRQMQSIEMALTTRQIQVYDHEITIDGRVQQEEVRVIPLEGVEEVLLIIRDISEQKAALKEREQSELSLQQSERTNRALIQAIPDFLVWMRLDGMQLEVINEQSIHCLYSTNGIVGNNVTEIMPLRIAQERIQLAQLAIATGILQKQEYEFTDGEQTYYEEARIVPVSKDAVLIVARDIGDRKQIELDLKSAKNQLELVLQASSEGFWDWNIITGNIYFSPEWKAMFGYEDHELENNHEMWQSLIFEEDLAIALQLVEDYNNHQLACFSVIQRFRHKNGSTVHILSKAIHLHNDQGNVTRMIGSHLDITQLVEIQEDLKTSEMQLSSILDSSLSGIMAFRSVRDEQNKIIDFEWLLSNPTACKLVGRSEICLIGNRLLVEMPGNRDEGLFDLYVQVVESGEPMHREFHYCHDGIDSWFENIAVKLGDGFAVTFRDITAIKQAEKSLQLANQQLSDRLADLKQRNTEMLLLSEISDFLQACLTVQEACIAISSLVEPLFPNCSGSIFITNPLRNQVENVTSWGDSLHSKNDFYPQECWGLRRGKVHFVGRDRLGLCCSHVDAGAAIDSTLCIPMIAQGETLGLFYLSTETTTALSESKQRLAKTLAEQVGLAIANLNLRETLQNQSIRDVLTGLFNRRYLEESLIKEVSRAQRNNYSIGIIMIDIDHFKKFNDTFRHDAGDYVLQSVGSLLKQSIRSSDIACRYGGEELTVILPEMSLQEAAIRAETIREAIAQLKISYKGQVLGKLTASLGVAAFPEHGSTGAIVMQSADAALYRAKEAGRNQVVVAL